MRIRRSVRQRGRDRTPRLVYANDAGEVFDHPHLEFTVRSGDTIQCCDLGDLIPLPRNSRLFTMPKRAAVGWDARSGGFIGCDLGDAVAAFPPPGYTRTVLPAAKRREGAEVLPLWAYSAVAWMDDQFWIAAIQVDDNPRWNPDNYDDNDLTPAVEARLAEFPENSVWDQLARCAIDYHCFAAKNAFLGRWELPMPVSPACNASCVGCISLQPEGSCEASHERVLAVPSVDDIVEVAVPHLESAELPIVSFGQGCEGDPILQAPIIERAIRRIRDRIQRGTINMNTNASKPRAIERLVNAGLDSLRVSLNSAVPSTYSSYYRPRGYSFDDVRESARIAKELGAYVSLNYLSFPGVNDRPSELDALLRFVEEARIDLIQMRNLSIDPDEYWQALSLPPEPGIGVRAWMQRVREAHPHIEFGYFNRPVRSTLEPHHVV